MRAIEIKRISVVICTHNPRVSFLRRAIAGVLSQEHCGRDVEFFIVDNASDSSVADLSIVANHNIKVVVEPRVGLAIARQCAWRHSSGDVLVFVDDDNVIAADYLKQIAELFSDPKVGVMSGRVLPEYEIALPHWVGRLEESLAIRRLRGVSTEWVQRPVISETLPVGAGIAIRHDILRDYFEAVPANSRVDGRIGRGLGGCEDLDIGFHAIFLGYKVGVSSLLCTTHIIPRERLTYSYMRRVVVASTRTVYAMHAKWQRIAGWSVSPMCQYRWPFLILKLVGLACLSVNRSYRIRFHAYATLALLRFQALHSKNVTAR